MASASSSAAPAAADTMAICVLPVATTHLALTAFTLAFLQSNGLKIKSQTAVGAGIVFVLEGAKTYKENRDFGEIVKAQVYACDAMKKIAGSRYMSYPKDDISRNLEEFSKSNNIHNMSIEVVAIGGPFVRD